MVYNRSEAGPRSEIMMKHQQLWSAFGWQREKHIMKHRPNQCGCFLVLVQLCCIATEWCFIQTFLHAALKCTCNGDITSTFMVIAVFWFLTNIESEAQFNLPLLCAVINALFTFQSGCFQEKFKAVKYHVRGRRGNSSSMFSRLHWWQENKRTIISKTCANNNQVLSLCRSPVLRSEWAQRVQRGPRTTNGGGQGHRFRHLLVAVCYFAPLLLRRSISWATWTVRMLWQSSSAHGQKARVLLSAAACCDEVCHWISWEHLHVLQTYMLKAFPSQDHWDASMQSVAYISLDLWLACHLALRLILSKQLLFCDLKSVLYFWIVCLKLFFLGFSFEMHRCSTRARIPPMKSSPSLRTRRPFWSAAGSPLAQLHCVWCQLVIFQPRNLRSQIQRPPIILMWRWSMFRFASTACSWRGFRQLMAAVAWKNRFCVTINRISGTLQLNWFFWTCFQWFISKIWRPFFNSFVIPACFHRGGKDPEPLKPADVDALIANIGWVLSWVYPGGVIKSNLDDYDCPRWLMKLSIKFWPLWHSDPLRR